MKKPKAIKPLTNYDENNSSAAVELKQNPKVGKIFSKTSLINVQSHPEVKFL